MGGRALTTGRREGDEIEYIARSSESHCQSHCQAHLQLIVSMRLEQKEHCQRLGTCPALGRWKEDVQEVSCSSWTDHP